MRAISSGCAYRRPWRRRSSPGADLRPRAGPEV